MRHFTNRHAELVPCGTSIPPVSSHVLVHPVGVRFTWFLRGFSPVDRCRGANAMPFIGRKTFGKRLASSRGS